MNFNHIYFTNAGSELINRAISGNTIVWGECACTSDTLTAASTAITNKVCSGYAVAAFNSGEGTAELSCSMDNTAADVAGGDAVSFGIYAKIQGDEGYILAIYATAETPMTIPDYDEDDGTTKVRVIVDLSLNINDGTVQTIEVTEPNVYALAQDLQTEINARQTADAALCTKTELSELESRVVTTNIQGSPTTGENQTIYGEKAFSNRIYANSGFTSNHLSYVYSAFGVGYNNQAYMLSMQYVGGSTSTVAQTGYSRICTKDSGQNDGTAIMRIGTWTSGGGYNYYLDLVRETRYQDFPSGFYWNFGACGIFREGIKFSGSIQPDAAATQQGYADVYVGIPSQPIAQVHAKHVHVKATLYANELSTEGSGDQIVLDGIGFNRIDSDEVFSGASTITNNGVLEFNNNNSTVVFSNSGVFNFNSDSGYNIQFNGGVEFNPAYSSGVVSFSRTGFEIKTGDPDDPVTINDEGIFCSASVDFDISVFSNPIRRMIAKDVYVTNGVYCNTYGGASGQTVGTSATPFEAIYGKRLHGVINYPVQPSGSSTVVQVPLGAIVCIQHAGIVGRTFTISNSTSVYTSILTGGAGVWTVPAGTYVALSDQSSSSGALLAMRIA